MLRCSDVVPVAVVVTAAAAMLELLSQHCDVVNHMIPATTVWRHSSVPNAANM
jgi:hypothetical protein